MTDTTEAKRRVAESGRMLLAEGLTARTWGNISCRTGENDMVITPSGLGYESMSADDIVPTNMTTGAWEGERKPSSEKAAHIAAYRAFPDAGFVIHTHQVYASAIGLTGLNVLFLSEEEKTALGGVALSGYALPGTKKLSKNIAAAFDMGAHTVLMARHGAVIAGKDQTQAFERARLLEKVCRRACKGQPAAPPALDEALVHSLTACAIEAFGHAAYTAAAPVLACAARKKAIPAQLDDMAQMLGARLIVVQPKEHALLQALQAHDAVLVPGVGAVCRAGTADDCRAMCMLLEKTCVCYLHTQASGIKVQLSWLDKRLMRFVYLKKYAKKKGS
jgi:ribulose-5-phosphate 4-epimerase/fuculose-1-phosphate aldolase